ncbi:UDP-N-acetylmuramoylalanine--D-glutamate ligase [Ectothiorhodospira magna]|uniref:UDP-N-acetylmuramoylalanine--D-glutamate ligase n=1 Tax=Ectothiorhodospira magna TaxID=867345 RepID=A0A1H9GHE0_9GAMM|nr:UDP-N-acetylmuramoyl-L-alanine--D-glutamate ligase [Ectothiorhodospira magna]SEQ49530.1 UDP-N-acetylmuramoylalanine--D-glutamate ligase [Ectothiorhodospira magna]
MTTQATTLIVGLGATGLSVARYLAGRGETFWVADTRHSPPGLARLRSFAPAVPVLCGPLDSTVLAGFSRLIVSPGVSLREPAIQAAQAAGVTVMGDIQLFAQDVDAPVLAVTGSNGKSTVTTLVGEMARAAGLKVAMGGNLGTPALDLLTIQPAPELYVLELSSFQLETTHSLDCLGAAVLNLSADHLDRYTGMEDYAQAKARIFNKAQVAIFNREDQLVAAMAGGQQRVSFGLDMPAAGHYGVGLQDGAPWLYRGDQPLLAASALLMVGAHNVANALAALALGDAAGLPMATMTTVLGRFAGLPHRCRWVASLEGVQWYNDSKGTNVGSTLAALEGLPGKVVLIAGGQAKGQDFSPLRAVAATRTRAVVLLGQDAALIEQALGDVVPVIRVTDMAQAVAEAARLARREDTVLLSPACASLDMFRSYAHRGEVFEAEVRRLIHGIC